MFRAIHTCACIENVWMHGFRYVSALELQEHCQGQVIDTERKGITRKHANHWDLAEGPCFVTPLFPISFFMKEKNSFPVCYKKKSNLTAKIFPTMKKDSLSTKE